MQGHEAGVRAMVEQEITSLIETREWLALKEIETQERETLEKVWRAA
jgi:hypothetical protein